MASSGNHDITPDIVLTLGHDKEIEPDYFSQRWLRIQAEQQLYARFITRRLHDAFPDDADSRSRALAVILEVDSLNESMAFAEWMRQELGDELAQMGGLAINNFESESESDGLPTDDFGQRTA